MKERPNIDALRMWHLVVALYFRRNSFSLGLFALYFGSKSLTLVSKFFFPGFYPPCSDSTSRNLAPATSRKYLRQEKDPQSPLGRGSHR